MNYILTHRQSKFLRCVLHDYYHRPKLNSEHKNDLYERGFLYFDPEYTDTPLRDFRCKITFRGVWCLYLYDRLPSSSYYDK